jgi:hypothetical protein
MGLAIGVNVLADLKLHDAEGYGWLKSEFARVNQLLQLEGLPLHNEPETLFPRAERPQLGSFPYSWLHYLRRAVAYQLCEEPLMPATAHPDKDELLAEEYYMLRSHLICHSDSAGFYLPLDFSDPVYDTKATRVAGGVVGSSFAVRRELQAVAPLLGIELLDGALPKAQAAQIANEAEGENAFWIERQVWLALYDSVDFSLQHGTAIVFQ